MKNGSSTPAPAGGGEARKRFYEAAGVARAPEGWLVQLDGRGVKTPGRVPLALPSRALAEGIAAEWDAQGEIIDPRTMPLTKLANTAIDGVTGREEAVRAEIVGYAGNDLLCYRAERPERLARLQHERWDPLLIWVTQHFGARLHTATGVMPVTQAPGCVAKLAEAIAALDALALTACHVMTTLTGSAVLALAHVHGRLSADEAWDAAHVDEDFQIAQWGEDAEARKRREMRHAEMMAAALFLGLSRRG